MEKIIRVHLSEELHKEFKIECLKNGQTFDQALTDLINYYITVKPQIKEDEKQN